MEGCLIFVTLFLLTTTNRCWGARNATEACLGHELQALLEFKHNVQDDYRMLSSWVGNDCCRWERVRCDVKTGNVVSLYLRGSGDYVFRDDYLATDVFRYKIRSEYLVGGELSTYYLGGLRHLKHLDLSGNDFQGSLIPKVVGSLNQLRYLNLSHAEFSGNIPRFIGNLSNLKVLDLGSSSLAYHQLMANDMSWVSSLLSLEHLDLSYVDLSRAQKRYLGFNILPLLKVLSLSNCVMVYYNTDLAPLRNSSSPLRNIKYLDLSGNYFESQLLGFVHNMTSLEYLDLSASFHLTDARQTKEFLNTIPSLLELHLSSCMLSKMHLSPTHLNFSTLSSIRRLDLSGNSFEDVFPSFLTNMTSLQALDLAGSFFGSVRIPVIPNLVELDLSSNNLNSSIPVMPSLQNLDLSSNNFKHIEDVGIWRQCHLKQLSVTGSLDAEGSDTIYSPTNISECSRYALERLYLDSIFVGTISDSLEKMANLQSLRLTNSKLTGPIPKSLGSLSSLQVLDLSHNLLTGDIPDFIGKLTKLDLSYNLLNGSIPESFTTLEGLTQLVLNNNMLTGSIPSSIGRLVSLQELSLSSNLLNGTIPGSIGRLTKLQSLQLSNNSLKGIVSEASFANLLTLKHMDLSSNSYLTFNVSRVWMPPFQLVTLDLSSSKIEDGFPQWLRMQRELTRLSLSNASISGPLPEWFRKMPVIPFLKLSHNNLSGPLTNLPDGETFNDVAYQFSRALLLQNNLFNGSIPKSFCKRTKLYAIQLSRNRLTGNIPNCLGDLQELGVLILSTNALSGVIPSALGNCSRLEWLKLNDNKFTGKPSQELGHLTGLKVLDLGDNELSGNMLTWIAESYNSLMVLRLHNNSFGGIIPRSLCTLYYLQILDVAQNNLTGTIPNCLGELNSMIIEHTGHIYDYHVLEQNVVQVMKGAALEYTTWDYVVNMDLSSNHLVGVIPVNLTQLSSLMGLNLSNNHLSGDIPNNVGNMRALVSLDLSKNELAGVIPPSIAALTFLSHLNLSHNNLSGRIPTGNQLQTLIDPSIYDGNKNLCGAPLTKSCSNHEHQTPKPNNSYEAFDEPKKVWFYLDIVGGFATGFWGVIGVLLYKTHWRHKLFMFAEAGTNKICTEVVIRVTKMKTWCIDPFRSVAAPSGGDDDS